MIRHDQTEAESLPNTSFDAGFESIAKIFMTTSYHAFLVVCLVFSLIFFPGEKGGNWKLTAISLKRLSGTEEFNQTITEQLQRSTV